MARPGLSAARRATGLSGAVVTTIAVLVSCTSHKPASVTKSSSARSSGTPVVGAAGGSVDDGLRVQVAGASVSIRAATVSSAAQSQLSALYATGVRHSPPVEITSDKPLSAAGAVLTRTYPEPLPAGSAAAFAFYDGSLPGWRVVPSDLSGDRRTLAATVGHLSLWTSLTAPVASWLTDVASKTTYYAGSFFDRRVEAPSCNGKLPAWATSATYLDDRNAPLRWCAGQDPAHSDWLVVKVRMNRGYGVALTTATRPQWTWNSFLNGDALDLTQKLLADAKGEASKWLSELASLGQELPGGEEVDYGFTEQQIRSARGAGVALVRAAQPTTTELAFSLIIDQLSDQVTDKAATYILGALAVLHCGASLTQAHNAFRLVGAVTDCLTDAREAITKELAAQLTAIHPERDPIEVGRSAAKYTRSLLIVAAAGLFLEVATYATDLALIEAARTFNVFTRRAATGRWTDDNLLITAHSLGAVTRGMTVDQATAAAGVTLTSIGDGILSPDRAITGTTSLVYSVGGTCFGASRTGPGAGSVVASPAGVALGDSMSMVRGVYGNQVQAFTADPSWSGPGNVPAGLLVNSPGGVLLFVGSTDNGRSGTIQSIRGAPDARTASSLFC